MNPMQSIKVEKITLNIGAGKEQKVLDKGILLLKKITGIEPVKTFSKKRIPNWGLRLGLPIGCKITLRKALAEDVLKRLIEAKDNVLSNKQFDDSGNLAFGIHEYIDIPGIEYEPDIGVMGLEVCVTLERPGYRIKRRKLKKKRIHVKHKVKKEEAISFMKEKYHVKIGEEE